MVDPNVAPGMAKRGRRRGSPPPPSRAALASIRLRSRAKFGKTPSARAVLKTYINNQARAARGTRVPPGQAKKAAGVQSARSFAPGQNGALAAKKGQNPSVAAKQPGARPAQPGSRTPTPGSSAGIAADPRTRQMLDLVRAGQRVGAGGVGSGPGSRPSGTLPGTQPRPQGTRPPGSRSPGALGPLPGTQPGGPGTRPTGSQSAAGTRPATATTAPRFRGMLPPPPTRRPAPKRPRRG